MATLSEIRASLGASVLDAFNAFCAPFVEDVRAVFMQKTAGVVRTLGESASHRRYAGPLVGLVVKPLTMTREQVADVAPETSARALACDFESFVDDVTRLGKDVRIGNLDVRHDVAMGDTGSPMLRLIWVMRGDVK